MPKVDQPVVPGRRLKNETKDHLDGTRNTKLLNLFLTVINLAVATSIETDY